MQAVIDFVYTSEHCRSRQLLAYFGEKINHRCGKCDVCTNRNRLKLTDIEFNSIKDRLLFLLSERPYPLFEIVDAVEGYPEEKVMQAIRWMLENRLIIKDQTERLTIRKQLDIH